MRTFSRLIQTDLRNRRTTILVTLGSVVVWNILFAVLPAVLSLPSSAKGLIMTLDIVGIGCMLFIPFLHCFSTWNEEWRHRTVSYLLALPVRRRQLIASKYTAIVCETLLFMGVMAIGMSLQNGLHDGTLFRSEPLLTFDWPKIAYIVKLILAVSALILLCFFSTLLGKCFGPLSALVTFLTFVAGSFVSILASAVQTVAPPTLVFALLCLAFYLGSLYVLEKKVGVEG
ncbi:ABC transporter permease [Paenibacillus sp. MBLB4367]|uniref:ABC transporter permease n=1 Tax=Paenibacillus sp. MBLB4367 TaxID=3384767 RepID=UPI003907F125